MGATEDEAARSVIAGQKPARIAGRGTTLGERLLQPWTALAAIVLGSAGLLTVGTWRVKEWVVMTDELLYAKLAGHIGHTGSPLPVLHGEHVGFLGVVYPIVLAPFYGTLDTVGAFEAAHVVNAVLFASTAIPTYLLARRLTTPACGLAVAVLVIAIPWALGAAFVMSEAAAYPVFVWAVLACQVALAEPSPRHDGLAIAGLALAYFTRPQFLFLVAVLPLAAIIVSGSRRALSGHRLLTGAYALGLLVVVPLAAVGEADRLLGDYGVTATHGSLLPAGVWKAAAIHLDVLAVGLGVVPFLLGAAWTYTHIRAASPPRRAFAALTGLCLPLLALETASYDLRFGGAGTIRDRYLFYLAPLLLLATAMCLQEATLPVIGIAAATAFFAATAALAEFRPVPGILVDSPESVLNGLIHDESAGLPAGVFVAICGVLLGLICLALAWIPRPAAVLGVTIAVFAFGGSVAGYAFDRLLTSRTVAGFPVTGQPRVRDWVDRVVEGSVGVLAYPVSRDWGQSAEAWWEAEFWNDSATRAFVVDRTFTYTPFPATPLRLDPDSGRFEGTEHAPPYVLTAQNDSRFGLAGHQAAASAPFVLLSVDRPYRALWSTTGLDPDGWALPGRRVLIRVYAGPVQDGRAIRVAVTLDAPPEAQTAAPYRLGAATGTVAPGGRTVAEAAVCVPRAGHADIALDVQRSAMIAGVPLGPEPGPPRDVGVAVSGVRLQPTGGSCS